MSNRSDRPERAAGRWPSLAARGFAHTSLLLRDPAEARALFVRLAHRAPTHLASGGPRYARGERYVEATAVGFDSTPEEVVEATYRSAAVLAVTSRPRHLAVQHTARLDPNDAAIAGITYDGAALVGEIVHGEARIAFDLAFVPGDLPSIPLRDDAHVLASVPVPCAIADGSIELDAPRAGRRWWPVRGWRTVEWSHGANLAPFVFALVDRWNERAGAGVVLAATFGRAQVLLGERAFTFALHASPDEVERARRWTMHGRAEDGTRLRAVISAADDTRVGLYTPSAFGDMTYAVEARVAHAELRVVEPGKTPLLLTSDAATFEVITRDANHGAPMFV